MPAAVAIQRTSRLVALSLPPRATPFQLDDSRPHFATNGSCRMYSTSDDTETDDRQTKTVLEYFNDNKFFEQNGDRKHFEDRFSNLDKDKKMMLMKTTHEFFEIAWRHEKRDGGRGLDKFLRDHIFGCKDDKVLLEYVLWKRYYGIGLDKDHIDDQPRLVNVDFQIQDTKLSHQYDLDCFSQRVDGLFDCHENEEERKKYAAPYFCFVQSSGMGKTKILWEYQNKPDDPKADPKNIVTSFVVIPTDPTTDEKPIFPILNLDRVGPFLQEDITNMTQADIKAHVQKVFRNVCQTLDKTLEALVNKHLDEHPGRRVRRVALLFDESQQLLKEEYGYKAFRFRCIRRWLMEKPTNENNQTNGTFRAQEKLIVVAVFSGTSSKLTNFLFENESDLSKPKQAPSRNFIEHETLYYDKGTMLHSPFWQTTTTGSCLYMLKKKSWKLSEYERAAYYGRPLFALMFEKAILHGKTNEILYRMLHRRTDWTRNNRIGLINLLSSRVQLGQVSVEMASDLVANSYANLCACDEDLRAVHLGYFPDPVPARLAMGMMDEDFLIDVEVTKDKVVELQGKDKKWWSNELKAIFSNEMVRPDKGDSGEIFVALYMLFCGDRLRKLHNMGEKQQRWGNQPYSQFSVSLDAWLNLMLSGGKFPNGKNPVSLNEDCKASVGFIQVCRNPLRSYNRSWKLLNNQRYLKHIYESGIGFFTCNKGKTIDMVVPIRIKRATRGNTDGFIYVPMLISIKSHADFTDSVATSFWTQLNERLERDKMPRALCLLIVFGSDEDTKPFEGDFATHKIAKDLLKGVVRKELRIPHDDVFGLSAAFADILPTAQFNADMFASHAFLKAHGSDSRQALNAKNALYSKAPKDLKTQHDALRTALKNPSRTSRRSRCNALYAALKVKKQGLLGNPQDADSSTNQSPVP